MMDKKILDENIDIEKYIEQRLLEMKNLEDRKMLREILNEVILPLYGHTQDKYEKLEEKLNQEIEACNGNFEIVTGIVDRKKFDVTNDDMQLMRAEDVEEKKVDFGEVLKALQEEKSIFLFTIFIKADYMLIKEIADSKRIFKGVIKTSESEYNAEFEIKRNQGYLKQIESLYTVFLNNKIPWKTVNAAYLYKMFDVTLISAEKLEGNEIDEIAIDFEEYEKYVLYDYVPIWNLKTKVIKTSVYPKACIDQIHYEHLIYKEKLDGGKFMICNEGIQLLNIQRIKDDLVITCREKNPVNWKMYQLITSQSVKFEEALMNNQSSITKGLRVRTKLELERFIISQGYSNYMELKSIRTQDGYMESIDTYNMDGFIEDEILLKNNNNSLIFYFEPKDREYYLNRDIMSYLVSRLQWVYPEYHCIGKFE